MIDFFLDRLFDEVNFRILLVAITSSMACALVGSFLLLRRLSLLGDAISHGVLPGLVIGFIVSGNRDLAPMLIGAAAAAMLVTIASDWLRDHGMIEGNAAMGIVFTTMFAIGIVLMEMHAHNVDLDPACVLYGQIESAAIDLIYLPAIQAHIPRSLVPIGVVLLIDLLVVVAAWKELKICCFDPALARALGFDVRWVHLLLMLLVSITTVACFEAVGSVLVVAMLVVPAATAHILCNRLSSMVTVAMATSCVIAISGVLTADNFDNNVPGMMATTGGGIFGIAVLLSPSQGLLSRLYRRARLSLRIASEDVLIELSLADERVPESLQGRSAWRLAASYLLWLRGWLARPGLAAPATERGRRLAHALLKRRQLWKRFLEEELQTPEDHLHDPAHRMEHHLDSRLTEKIERDLDQEGGESPIDSSSEE